MHSCTLSLPSLLRPIPQTTIPPSWVSSSDGRVWNLDTLMCAPCGLQGTLPAGWDDAALRVLELSSNDFTGPIQHVIAGSPGLDTLRMAYTGIQDELGPGWAFSGASPLTSLDLSNNPGLNGSIPLGEKPCRRFSSPLPCAASFATWGPLACWLPQSNPCGGIMSAKRHIVRSSSRTLTSHHPWLPSNHTQSC
jgi:hypothetical protein